MKKFTILCIIQLFFLYNLVEAQCSLTASIASQTNVSCNGGSNGQLLVSVSGGTSPYTYLWSNAAGTAGIVGLSAGTFTVSISDANSCTVSISATITEPAALSSPTITAGGSTTICPGSTVDLSITPVSDVSYCWSEGGAPTQNWQAVGNAGFTSSYVDDPSLAFDPVSGDPFIAFRDVGSSNKATVMKFNGSSWEVVGSAGFSAGSALYTSLSFDPLNGIPYVAYRDGGNSSKATVMKYDGSSWVTVGSSGFSAGEAGDISFAFDPVNGAPFIAYSW